ncbi:MAG: hypothetical protein ACLPUT_17740 [Solirubrobacteraceae bacterium]
MHATSDIFEHRRRASSENGSQPTQAAQASLVDERLIDEFARRLADKLAPLLIEQLADRLGVTSEQLRARLAGPAPGQPEALVDASEIARRTGRSRWWVYEHAGELGAVRLGSGSRPRLAFWPMRVDEYLQAAAELRQPIPAPARARPQRRRHARRTSTGVELLPIRGHDG